EALEVLADRGYFSGEEILACGPLGVTPILPKPLTSGAKADGRFGKQDFSYIVSGAFSPPCAPPPSGEHPGLRGLEVSHICLRVCPTTAARMGGWKFMRASAAAGVGARRTRVASSRRPSRWAP